MLINNSYQVFGSLDAVIVSTRLPLLPSICSVSGLPKLNKLNYESKPTIQSVSLPVPLLP